MRTTIQYSKEVRCYLATSDKGVVGYPSLGLAIVDEHQRIGLGEIIVIKLEDRTLRLQKV